jgi:hypothetical protein
MKDSFKMIKLMVKADFFIMMEPIMMVLGMKICNMEMVKKYGLMEQFMKVNSLMVRNMARENLFFLIKQNIMVT